MPILEHLKQLCCAKGKVLWVIHLNAIKCMQVHREQRQPAKTALAIFPRTCGNGRKQPLSLSFCVRKVKCLELPRRYPSFTHKGREWKTGNDPIPPIPNSYSLLVLSVLSDLTFPSLSFLSQYDAHALLLLPLPLLHWLPSPLFVSLANPHAQAAFFKKHLLNVQLCSDHIKAQSSNKMT